MRFWLQFESIVSLHSACAVVLLYGTFILFGTRIMSGKDACNLSATKRIYNLVQISLCGAIFWRLLPYFVSSEYSYGIGLEPSQIIEFWVFVYYCSKILDLGDTVFMVLEKKSRQLTFLHVWHHASIIPLFAYYLSAGLGAGSVSTLPLLNSGIHVLMYSHYLFVTLAPNIRPWWKPILTLLQICQHICLMVYMILNMRYGRREEFSPQVFMIGMLWGLSILALFGNFYVQQYLSSSKRQSRPAQTSTAAKLAQASTEKDLPSAPPADHKDSLYIPAAKGRLLPKTEQAQVMD